MSGMLCRLGVARPLPNCYAWKGSGDIAVPTLLRNVEIDVGSTLVPQDAVYGIGRTMASRIILKSNTNNNGLTQISWLCSLVCVSLIMQVIQMDLSLLSMETEKYSTVNFSV